MNIFSWEVCLLFSRSFLKNQNQFACKQSTHEKCDVSDSCLKPFQFKRRKTAIQAIVSDSDSGFSQKKIGQKYLEKTWNHPPPLSYEYLNCYLQQLQNLKNAKMDLDLRKLSRHLPEQKYFAKIRVVICIQSQIFTASHTGKAINKYFWRQLQQGLELQLQILMKDTAWTLHLQADL